jgi:hypothetical protein
MSGGFIKHYPDQTSCRTAASNHDWLAGQGLPVPPLLLQENLSLEFEHIDGRHALPTDLVRIAGHMGAAHARTHLTELHRAQLDHPYRSASGALIRDFLSPRLHKVRERLHAGLVPNARLNAVSAEQLIRSSGLKKAAFYKDSNPRNILITQAGPVLVDFDDLTLAPFGYDLAKLIVALAMTHGSIEQDLITMALAEYNTALDDIAALTTVPWEELMAWAEVHHALTSHYVGQGGYRFTWDQVRPVGPIGRDQS